MDWYCSDCEEMVEEPVENGDTGDFECPHCGSIKVNPIT